MERFVLLGAPGVGKGTLAQVLSKDLKIPHISTGDLFRAEIANKTPFGLRIQELLDQGIFVSDEETGIFLFGYLAQLENQKGYLLDGYPRNLNQAKALDAYLHETKDELTGVILLELDEKTIVDRLGARRVCPQCGASYNLVSEKPLQDGICDQCQTPLIRRADDEPETVKKRLTTYHKQTEPLIAYYQDRGILHRFTNHGTPEELAQKILTEFQLNQA